MADGPKIWEEIGSSLEEAVHNITRKDVRGKVVDPARVRAVVHGQQESRRINDAEAKELTDYLASLNPKPKKT